MCNHISSIVSSHSFPCIDNYNEDNSLFLRETQMLRETLGEDRFADYSIGFVRYEKDEEDDNSSQRQIWEHYWDLSSSVEGFDNRHLLVHISGMNQTNFNGGAAHIIKVCSWPLHNNSSYGRNDRRIVVSTRHGF
jgi:hypothetical protein